METIKYTDDLRNYELTHWRAHKGEEDKRPGVMRSMFPDISPDYKVAADVGCGPHCGVFNELSFDKMYAIDPLWESYEKEGLSVKPEGVVTICSDAQNFELKEKADVIFSFNALDHSGNLESSINNIMNNIRDGGSFCLHVHMRTPEQLNAGHKMVIKEEDLDRILSKWETVRKRIEDVCPLDRKKYRSYIAEIKK